MGINKKFVAKNGVDNNNQRLTNVAIPSESKDAANKAYVDSMAAGLDTKQSVKVASTTNINIAGGEQTIDGVSVVFGDRVLVKNQTNSTENGIYIVTTNTWYRPDDINAWSQFPGAFTFVEQGTTNADTGWVCIVNAGGTIGVTPITWTQFAGTGSITTLKLDDGTVANPALSFKNDTNSGLYRAGADNIALVTGGVDRLNIDSSGNVYVGPNAPVAGVKRLTITNTDSGATSSSQMILASNNGNLWLINASTAQGGGSVIYSDNSSGVLSLQTYNAIPLVFGTSNAERMRISPTGNVGIGTNSPAYKLQVYGGTAAVGGGGIDGRWQGINNNNIHVMDFGIGTLSGYPDSIGLTNTTSTGSLDFGTNNAIRMRINSNGKIGVNTNNPKGKVDIYNPNGFVPSNSTVANAALVVAGEYGGGITLVDGTHYSSLYNIGGRFSIGSGTASGVMERLTIDSTGNVGIGTATPSSYSSAYSKVLTTLHGDQGITVGSYYQSGVTQYGFINAGGANNGWETPLVFQTGGTEKVRIDAGGNVGIGDPNPSGWNSKLMVKAASGYVQSTVLSQGNASSDIASLTVGANGSTYAVTTQAYGDGFVQVQLNGAAGKERRTILTTSNSPRWAYGVSNIAESGSNAGSNFYIVRYSDTGAYLGTPITIYRSSGEVYFDGPLLPVGDNTRSLGNGAARWSVVYAGTGTINTSDAREKNEVRSLTEAEISAAQALSKEIGAYKFLSAIAEKGDAAREHIGMTVQRAIEIMESFGLVPFNYGFICYDEWDTETQTIPAVEASDAVIGENGDVVVPAVEAKPEEIKVIREAGNRYSFRMDELSMFISRGLVAKLESIEARLAALEV